MLVTGFEPFGGGPVNPSGELALALNGEVLGDLKIVGRVLPVEYVRSVRMLFELIARLKPVVVICTGLSAMADSMKIERVAVNEDDCASPDNAREIRERRVIFPGEPRTRSSTLAIDAILGECTARGLVATGSRDAGRYVCNHVFYLLMQSLGESPMRIPAGFIHVPGEMPMSEMKQVVQIAIQQSLGENVA